MVSGLPKSVLLKNSKEFERFKTESEETEVGKHVVIKMKKSQSDTHKFGFIVTTKIGNAVFRNKVKRVLKEIIRNNIELFCDKYDYLFLSRYSLKNVDKDSLFHLLKDEVISLMK